MSLDKQAARDLAIARRCFIYGMHHGGERVTSECLLALVAAVDASLGGVGPEHLHYCSRCRRIGRKEGASDAKREAVGILARVLRLASMDGYAMNPHADRDLEAARAYIAAEADAAEEGE
jgi:hypothetical protein